MLRKSDFSNLRTGLIFLGSGAIFRDALPRVLPSESLPQHLAEICRSLITFSPNSKAQYGKGQTHQVGQISGTGDRLQRAIMALHRQSASSSTTALVSAIDFDPMLLSPKQSPGFLVVFNIDPLCYA